MRRGQKQPAPHYMEPLVDEYVAYRTSRNRKLHAGNRSMLLRLAKEWDHETRNEAPSRLIDNIDREWMEDYFLEKYGDKQPVTKRAYQSQIRQFIMWMGKYNVSREAADFDPGRTAGKSERKKLWLSADQMRQAWENESDVYWRCLFMFLGLTCCRFNELQAARWGDIKGNKWNIHRSKVHNFADILTLVPRLCDELDRYKFWYRGEIGRDIEDTDYVFPLIRNTNIGRSFHIEDPKDTCGDSIHRKIKKMIMTVLPEDTDPELLDGAGCHTLRRSGAQALLDKIAKLGKAHALKIVSKILGHDKVSTTEGYLNVDVFIMERNEVLEDLDLFDDDTEAKVIPLRAVD